MMAKWKIVKCEHGVEPIHADCVVDGDVGVDIPDALSMPMRVVDKLALAYAYMVDMGRDIEGEPPPLAKCQRCGERIKMIEEEG